MSGSQQVGVSAPATLIQSRTQGMDLVAIGNAGGIPETGGGGGEVIAHKDSGLTSITELEGKTVAIYGLKSNNELTVRADIDGQGGDASKVDYVEMEFPAMMAALDRGDVDAAAIAEPFLTAARASDDYVSLSPYIENAGGKGSPITVWFTSQKQIDENGDVIARFVRALDKSSEYADANEDETRATLLTFTQMTEEQANAIPMQAHNLKLTDEQFELVADLMVEYDFIDEKPDMSGIVYQRQ